MTAIEFNNHILSFSDKLRFFALSLTSNRDDADDLFQETYLKAFSYRERISDFRNLKAWVYTIMKNTYINQYRRLYKSSAQISHTEEPYELEKDKRKYTIAGDVELTTKEIMKVINSLDPEFRDTFRMFLDGYKYKEISKEHDIVIGTVKSRIFHARKKLMNQLADYRD